ALPSDGAGLSVMAEGQVAGGGGTVAASSPTSRRLEEIQFSLAEGPCFDAFTLRHPVLESDLAGHGMRRWLGYGPAAHEEGVRAVFAFPLQVGAARLGALDIYRAKPGSLSPRAVSQAATFAEVAMTTLLDGQQAAPDGEVATGLDDVLQGRAEIYQAQGMVQVHLGVSLIEAMARLRAHAYVNNQVLGDLARDVVAGRTVLTRDAS
ncbi:MAG: GAF and ANTAR domain-containing protein, partial [Lapillicoccus sp.]